MQTISTILAIKDELTETFMQPIFLKGNHWKEEATRLFKHQINSIPLWKSNPSDYSLYVIGQFDENSGTITPVVEKITGGRSVLEE